MWHDIAVLAAVTLFTVVCEWIIRRVEKEEERRQPYLICQEEIK